MPLPSPPFPLLFIPLLPHLTPPITLRIFPPPQLPPCLSHIHTLPHLSPPYLPLLLLFLRHKFLQGILSSLVPPYYSLLSPLLLAYSPFPPPLPFSHLPLIITSSTPESLRRSRFGFGMPPIHWSLSIPSFSFFYFFFSFCSLSSSSSPSLCSSVLSLCIILSSILAF